MNIYETCPTLKSERFILRLFQDEDCNDLLKVYSDKNALPFFNSDNCDGDNFYYATEERMAEAIRFWHMAYENGWFVRLSIGHRLRWHWLPCLEPEQEKMATWRETVISFPGA